MVAQDEPGFRTAERGVSRRLVVLLHACKRTAADMAPLAALVRAEMPDADTWAPPLPIAKLCSRSRATDITAGLIAGLDRLTAGREAKGDGGRYDTIVFVGHSYGAVLARAVWATAAGGQPDGTACLDYARPWAGRVARIVLLAAVARGWNPAAPMGPSTRIMVWLSGLIETVAGSGFALLDLRRGAPFLTTMRLQTLAVLAALGDEGRSPTVTVQLLGTVDDVVAPADNVDLATGGGFYYVEVPGADHMNVVEFTGPGGATRRDLFRTALVGQPADLAAISVPRQTLADMIDEALDDHDVGPAAGGPGDPDASPRPLHVRRDVRTVVFLVHGIRDYGYWTRKLAVHLKRRARDAGIACRTVTSSYGFFAMGPFLVRAERRKRAGWFMDQYVTARATYPEADTFCFVGHSNGTYLLARALLDCPAVRMDRVVFAGSVVRPDYPWRRLMEPPPKGTRQVSRVLNYVASADWVVASVPSAVQPLRVFDLGGAGHRGFAAQPGVVQVEFVPGSHSAALGRQHWDDIADFVLDGKDPDTAPREAAPWRAGSQKSSISRLGRWAWLVLPAGVLGLCAIFGGLLWLLSSLSLLVFSLGLIVLFWSTGRVLTRL